MASTPLFSSLLLASLFIPGFMAPTSSGQNSTPFIRTSCSHTTYPDLCVSSLSRYANLVGSNPVLLARFAMNATIERLRPLSAWIDAHCRHFAANTSSPGDLVARVLQDCSDLIKDATEQVRRSEQEMAALKGKVGPDMTRRIENAETWLSAAITDESTCTDEFEGGPDANTSTGTEGDVSAEVSKRVDGVRRLTSNALALVVNLPSSIHG